MYEKMFRTKLLGNFMLFTAVHLELSSTSILHHSRVIFVVIFMLLGNFYELCKLGRNFTGLNKVGSVE